MKVLVTGATGFIGGNLTVELLKRGYEVRALVRGSSDRRNLRGLEVEIAHGDLRDGPSLERALEGCEGLFHVAADYTLWTPRPKDTYETNVRGTETLLAAAAAQGVSRVVYTSTESTIGIDGNGQAGTEATVIDPRRLGGHYKRSKYQAEQLALRMCRAGLPLVVVNPTVPTGPRDVKPTPTGQIVVDFLSGRMPAYVDTGLNVVDVRDVAVGHILAFEKGRTGERYILGNRNLTLKQILGMLGKLAGRPAPRFRIPLWFALSVAYADEAFLARLAGRPPRVPIAGVKAASHYRHFDCSKAIQELGMPQTPVETALADATRWFTENGYVH